MEMATALRRVLPNLRHEPGCQYYRAKEQEYSKSFFSILEKKVNSPT
jgi:hypothetical protein